MLLRMISYLLIRMIPIGVDSDDANSVMDLIRKEFVNGDGTAPDDDSGIKLVDAEEFS